MDIVLPDKDLNARVEQSKKDNSSLADKDINVLKVQAYLL